MVIQSLFLHLLIRNYHSPDGYSEFPFEFKLEPSGSHKLQETYHGVYVSIEYSIVVDLKRALLSKALKKMIQFIVEVEVCLFKVKRRS